MTTQSQAPETGTAAVDEPGLDRAAARTPLTSLGTGRRMLLGAVGGLVAGAVFIGITMWFAAAAGSAPVAPFKLISTIVLPADMPQGGNVWVGAGLHAVLSALFGLAFALAAPALRSDDNLVSAGAAYGGFLYFVDFLVLGHTLFPQFQMTNQPFEFAAHVIFGALLGGALVSTGSVEPRGSARWRPSAQATRILGALAAGGAALIHLALARRQLQLEFYTGVLFVIGATALIYTAVQLVRRPTLSAWALGALVTAGMFVGYILSLTVGLPAGFQAPRLTGLGTSALAMEALFVVVYLGAVLRGPLTS